MDKINKKLLANIGKGVLGGLIAAVALYGQVFFLRLLVNTKQTRADVETEHIVVEETITAEIARPDRFDILMDFEGFKPGVAWTVNPDANNRSFGPFQFYMGQKGQFNYFMAWLKSKNNDLHGQLAAANRQGPAIFKIKSESMFKTSPELFECMKEYLAGEFDTKLDRASKTYGIECANRDETILGFLLCIYNNRNNDIYNIFAAMTKSEGGANGINAMNDADFYRLLGAATKTVLGKTLAHSKWKNHVISNFARIHDEYAVCEAAPEPDIEPTPDIKPQPKLAKILWNLVYIESYARAADAVEARKITTGMPVKGRGLLKRAEFFRANTGFEISKEDRHAPDIIAGNKSRTGKTRMLAQAMQR